MLLCMRYAGGTTGSLAVWLMPQTTPGSKASWVPTWVYRSALYHTPSSIFLESFFFVYTDMDRSPPHRLIRWRFCARLIRNVFRTSVAGVRIFWGIWPLSQSNFTTNPIGKLFSLSDPSSAPGSKMPTYNSSAYLYMAPTWNSSAPRHMAPRYSTLVSFASNVHIVYPVGEHGTSLVVK
jgi:hypothetical protein